MADDTSGLIRLPNSDLWLDPHAISGVKAEKAIDPGQLTDGVRPRVVVLHHGNSDGAALHDTIFCDDFAAAQALALEIASLVPAKPRPK